MTTKVYSCIERGGGGAQGKRGRSLTLGWRRRLYGDYTRQWRCKFGGGTLVGGRGGEHYSPIVLHAVLP
jgi:hypothetical protein